MKKLLALVLSLLPFTAGADVFSKYAPVAGIQKSTGLDYHNTAAAASDVTPLFGCGGSSTLFLRGDGSCSAPAGTGVASVSVPVPLTASSCSGGACSITWTTGQTANRVLATPDGTTGAVSLRALVAGDVPPIALGSTANGGVASASILLGTNGGTSNGFFSVTGPTTALRTFTFPNASATVLTTNAAVTVSQGGTGLATLTAHGVLLGEGTSNLGNVAAMAADTLLMGQGVTSDPAPVAVNNCGSATSALSYSTSTHTFGCQTITSGGTGTVTSITGGTGINASPNPLISSGTLTVDQTFSPNWSGTHIFSKAGTGSESSSPVRIESTRPQIGINQTGAATDAKKWFIQAASGQLAFQTIDDAETVNKTFLEFDRTGNAVTAVLLGNATDNPTYTFLGTGTATYTGPIVSNATGVGLTVNANGSSNSLVIAGTTGRSALGEFAANGNTAGTSSLAIGQDSTGANRILGRNNASLLIGTNGATHITDSATGNITLSSPSSGTTLTVGAPGTATVPGINSTGPIESSTNSTTQYILNSSGANFGFLQNDSSGVWSFAYGTTIGTLGTPIMKWTATGGVQVGSPTGGDKGVGAVNMTGCFVNNVPCLTGASTATRFTAGVITIGASSCTVNQNTSGISGCTFNSTGNVTVTFSSAFTAATCVANAVNSNPTLLASQPGTSITSGVQINLDNTSGTPTNGILSVLCLGN